MQPVILATLAGERLLLGPGFVITVRNGTATVHSAGVRRDLAESFDDVASLLQAVHSDKAEELQRRATVAKDAPRCPLHFTSANGLSRHCTREAEHSGACTRVSRECRMAYAVGPDEFRTCRLERDHAGDCEGGAD